MAAIDINNCFTYAYSAGTQDDFFQAVTAQAWSTNAIDLDAAGIRIAGGSKPPWYIVKVGTALATCVSMEIRLVTGTALTSGDISAGAKEVKIHRFLRATMAAGALLINEPLGHFDYQRYLQVEFKPFTSATGGTFLAYLSDGPETAVTDIDLVEAGT